MNENELVTSYLKKQLGMKQEDYSTVEWLRIKEVYSNTAGYAYYQARVALKEFGREVFEVAIKPILNPLIVRMGRKWRH